MSHGPKQDQTNLRSDRPRRLGKNQGGYAGDCIDIDAVLADCVSAAAVHGWRVDKIGSEHWSLLAFVKSRDKADSQLEEDQHAVDHPTQSPRSPPLRIYISAGIHGDEPAGPLAARALLQSDAWPENVSLWICPCLNPVGFRLNCRGNEAGVDLNRQYRNPQAAEIRAHIAWLDHQPRFDMALCLHEDWEAHGFYFYELNPNHQPSVATAILQAVAPVCPIDLSELIEGRAAQMGLIRPEADPAQRPDFEVRKDVHLSDCSAAWLFVLQGVLVDRAINLPEVVYAHALLRGFPRSSIEGDSHRAEQTYDRYYDHNLHQREATSGAGCFLYNLHVCLSCGVNPNAGGI